MIKFHLPTGLTGNDFVATFDPITQAYFVWIQQKYFLEIGALNGVIISSSTISSGNSFGLFSACPYTFTASVASISYDSMSVFDISVVNDHGMSQSDIARYPPYSASVSNPVVSPMCASSAVEAAFFVPFSCSDPTLGPYLYLVNTSDSNTDALPLNSDRMTTINCLSTFYGPFDTLPAATRAIYVEALQSNLNIRVVEIINNQSTTTTLPFSMPTYQTTYVFSDSILRSASAFVEKSSLYVFPMMQLTSFQPFLSFVFVPASTKASNDYIIFDTQTTLVSPSVVIAIAVFP